MSSIGDAGVASITNAPNCQVNLVRGERGEKKKKGILNKRGGGSSGESYSAQV